MAWFTGAEDIKTAEEAAIYGGTAGVAYDPCYHQACDTLANLSTKALDEMSDASAHAALTFAQSTSAVQGTDKGKALGHGEFNGNHLRRLPSRSTRRERGGLQAACFVPVPTAGAG